MKTRGNWMRWLLSAALLVVFGQSLAEDENNLLQDDQPPYRIHYGEFEITLGTDPRIDGVIHVYKNRQLLKACPLKNSARRLLLSHDRSAIIVNDDSYLSVGKLLNCKENEELQEQKVPNAYRLTDINLRKRIYVSARTLSSESYLPCVATVAKIGSTRNLVNLPGVFVPGLSETDLLSRAFSCPIRSYISPDGRYVALEKIDCSEDARAGTPESWDDPSSRGNDPYSDPARFTGVWDIKTNKRVLFSLQQFTAKEIAAKCFALFDTTGQIRGKQETK